jgi:hypothetical protein
MKHDILIILLPVILSRIYSAEVREKIPGFEIKCKKVDRVVEGNQIFRIKC